MNGATQLRFALNIQHLTAAKLDPSSNPAGSAEIDAPDRHHRQAVYLTDLGAISLNSDGVRRNQLVEATIKSVRAAASRIDRTLNGGATYRAVAGQSGKIVGFGGEIRQRAHICRKFLRIARQA